MSGRKRLSCGVSPGLSGKVGPRLDFFECGSEASESNWEGATASHEDTGGKVSVPGVVQGEKSSQRTSWLGVISHWTKRRISKLQGF